MGWNVCWTKSRMVDVVFSRMVIMSNGARQQLSMWVAVQSTLAPHIQQVCGLQIGMARRRPTAIRTVSSSKWRPKDDIGRAFNQAPDSLQETASRREHKRRNLNTHQEVIWPNLIHVEHPNTLTANTGLAEPVRQVRRPPDQYFYPTTPIFYSID